MADLHAGMRSACRPGLQRRSAGPHARRMSVRAMAVSVTFKVQRPTTFGQSLLIVGNAQELGAWNPTAAKELTWGDGHVWSVEVAVPDASALEYKYVIKRRDGLDWCPGANKALTLPPAAAVEVRDNWDNGGRNVSVTAGAAAASAAEEEEEEAAAAAEVAELGRIAATASPDMVEASAAAALAPAPVAAPEVERFAFADKSVTVSTMDNVYAEELEEVLPVHAPPAPAAAPAYLANNIVQAVPRGAVAVGQAADAVPPYEAAKLYQSGDLITSGGTATATSTSQRTMDAMTVSELKTDLKRRGMSSFGTRRELITRLQKAGAL